MPVSNNRSVFWSDFIHLATYSKHSKTGLDSKNYQILDDSIILQHLKLNFLKILFGEEKKKTEH